MTVENHHPAAMIFIFVVLVSMILITSLMDPDKQDINKTQCPVCDKEKIQLEADKQIYLKLARATKKYCSANWFDGSEVCQHLETECYNYCIKTTEKNCRVECESKI